MKTGTDLVGMEDLSRRRLLRQIALGVTLAAPMTLEAGQHVHAAAQAVKPKGAYQPKLFEKEEFATLGRLAELIIPADAVSGSGKEAGAAEFIDLLCSQNEELAAIFRGGLLWLEATMRRRYHSSFLSAAAAQQTALLDALVEASRRAAAGARGAGVAGWEEAELSGGLRFWEWVVKMTVDAFYTSPLGIQDLGFQGNAVRSKYEVPTEAIEYAFKRSPFAQG